MLLEVIFNNLQLNLSVDDAINILSGYGDSGPYQTYFKCNYNNGGSFVTSTTIQYVSDNNKTVYVGETLSNITMTVIISGNSQTIMLPVASFDSSTLTLDTTPTITVYGGGNDKNIKYLQATAPSNLENPTYANGFFLNGLDTDFNVMPATQSGKMKGVPAKFWGASVQYMTVLIVQNYTGWLLVGSIDSLPQSSTTIVLPASGTGVAALMDAQLYSYISDNSDLFVPEALGMSPLNYINPVSTTGDYDPYSYAPAVLTDPNDPIDINSASSSTSTSSSSTSSSGVSTTPLRRPPPKQDTTTTTTNTMLIIVMLFVAFIVFVIAVVAVIVILKKYNK